MLRKIPYSTNLISIGNAVHTPGKPVWSDGNVAYGWYYMPEAAKRDIRQNGGFWVGEFVSQYDYSKYKLAGTDLALGQYIVGGPGYQNAYAYPAVADYDANLDSGYVYRERRMYRYTCADINHLIYLDGDGRTVCYEALSLVFRAFSQNRAVDSHDYPLQLGRVTISDGDGEQLYSGYMGLASDGNGNAYVYGAYYVRTENYSNPEASLINGTLTFDDYTGAGTIMITDAFDLYEPAVTIVSLADLAISGGLQLFDHWEASLSTSYSPTRNIFQLAKHDSVYITANTYDRDSDGDIIYSGDYDVHFEAVIAQGAGTVIEQSGEKYAYDAGGNLVARCNAAGSVFVYTGGSSSYAGVGRVLAIGNQYSVRVEPNGESGTGYIEHIGNYVTVKNNDGETIVRSNASGIVYYYNNNPVYSGPGYVTITNETQTQDGRNYGIYTIHCSLSGSGDIIEKSGDVYVYNNGVVTLNENGEDVDIPNIYNAAGWIETANLIPYKSIKTYRITPAGVELRAYPNSFSIGTAAELRFTGITDISLAFTDDPQNPAVINNDPLGLLTQPSTGHKIVVPGGVYAAGRYILDREAGNIWSFTQQTPESRAYNGILKCFSLAWLNHVWRL